MRVRKTPKDVIHLLGTPVPAAEQEPLAPIVEAIAGTGGSGHFLPFVNAKSPDVPGEVDIAIGLGAVSNFAGVAVIPERHGITPKRRGCPA